MKLLILLFTLTFTFFLDCSLRIQELPVCNAKQRDITTIYGTFSVEEPIIWELLSSPVMERLKSIHQYGISNYVDDHVKEYSRYDHSVGVWALLRRYKTSQNEQIAGLLHDASHTVFSHTGDYLFLKNIKESYQDGIHEWYLRRQQTDVLLEESGISFKEILQGNHRALEQELPDLCADRIEYNIQEGLMNGMILCDEVAALLETLFYEDGVWYFTDISFARKIGLVSLYGSENQWGGPNSFVQNSYAARALAKGVELGVITFDEIHFSEDTPVLQKLMKSEDPILKGYLEDLFGYKTRFEKATMDQYDLLVLTKFRGVNPLIQLACGSRVRLTEVDELYRLAYFDVQQRIASGYPIRYVYGR